MSKGTLLRKPLSAREVQIFKRLKSKLSLPVTKIAMALDRHKKTMYKILNGQVSLAKRGAKSKLKKADVDRIAKIIRAMIKHAKARYEVTLSMIKKRAKVKVCDKVLRKALAARKIKFRTLRSKPILTEADRRARYAFAKKYRVKTKEWWVKRGPRLHINAIRHVLPTQDISEYSPKNLQGSSKGPPRPPHFPPPQQSPKATGLVQEPSKASQDVHGSRNTPGTVQDLPSTSIGHPLDIH